jgi:hypothetical protein
MQVLPQKVFRKASHMIISNILKLRVCLRVAGGNKMNAAINLIDQNYYVMYNFSVSYNI